MKKPKYSLFFDFHTLPDCPDVGKNFDADAFTDHVKECGVDFVIFPAICNMGMAYYNTKIGTRHPSLSYDLLERLSASCVQKSIILSAYVNTGLSHSDALEHRDWVVVSPEGYIYKPDRLNHFFRCMCYNSSYRKHLLSMIEEIVSQYPVGGLFLDCMHNNPCVGVECLRKMKEKGLDWKNKEDIMFFASDSRVSLIADIAEKANSIRKGLLLYFNNGLIFEDQLDKATYFEYECLPTASWGYESLPVYARFIRNFGKDVLNMTGRFHKTWGDFGGIRTEASLKYDCLYGLAHGLYPNIGDHFHPRGDVNKAVFSLVKKVYNNIQQYDEWFDDAKAVTDVALLAPSGFSPLYYDEGKYASAFDILKGATRMLCEEKIQFDVITERMAFDKYKLLILPDEILVNKKLAEKISKFLSSGGKLIASAFSGLDPEKRRFVFSEWGMKYLGETSWTEAFFKVDSKLAEKIPDMPLSLYDTGCKVRALEGSEVLADTIAPFFKRYWDGEFSHVYLPPDKPIDEPFVVHNGNVFYISRPLFSSYYKHAQVPLRQLLRNIIDILNPTPLIKTENLPSFARVSLCSQPEREMLHILSFLPEQRGENCNMIEEPVVLQNPVLMLNLRGRKLKKVYTAPSREKTEFTVEGAYARVELSSVTSGYAMLVFEYR